jgi:excisionase family DNA binding protein
MQQTAVRTTAITTKVIFISVPEVAALCGVTPRTVYAWVSDGKLRQGIEYVRPRGTRKLRFDAAKIFEWFQSGEAK